MTDSSRIQAAYRIIEDVYYPMGPNWTRRFYVQRYSPSRQVRFLWWSWTVPGHWDICTKGMERAECRQWIEAAKAGELTRVVS